MLHERQMGRDGRKPETCAVSGKPLAPEDMYTTINGVKVGVKGYLWSHMTAAARAEFKEAAAGEIPPAPHKPARLKAAPTPDSGKPLDLSDVKGE